MTESHAENVAESVESALRARILELRERSERGHGVPVWITEAEADTGIRGDEIREAITRGEVRHVGAVGGPHQVDSAALAAWAARYWTVHHRTLFPDVVAP